MIRSTRLTAEQKFAATQKRAERDKQERDRDRDARAAQIARPRALRLAKERDDDAGDEAKDGDAADDTAKGGKTDA